MKIARARIHLAELQSQWSAYIASNPVTVKIVSEPKPQEVVELHHLPPEMIPAIFGDIIHNLRSSLDLLASDLVRLNGHSPDNVYFPFAEGPDQIDQMITRRGMDRAAPGVVQLLKELKPYKGGNVALRAIHDLDIMDKHQSLLLTTIRFRTELLEMGYEHFSIQEGATWWTAIYNGSPPTNPRAILPKLNFPGNAPLEGQEVIPMTESLIKDVLGVIEAFELLLWGTITE